MQFKNEANSSSPSSALQIFDISAPTAFRSKLARPNQLHKLLFRTPSPVLHFPTVKDVLTRSDREAVDQAIETLARFYSADGPQHVLYDRTLSVIDQAAHYISIAHGTLPDATLAPLENATKAATRCDIPRVLHQIQSALEISDRLRTEDPHSKTSPKPKKPMKKHIDPLLAALRAKRAPKS